MSTDPRLLIPTFMAARARTETLAEPLTPEDQQLQAMPCTSPVKWHRAHTTWFFDSFVLARFGKAAVRPEWNVLFNSYYEAAGPRHARSRRGLLSRPTSEEIGVYRQTVDDAIVDLLKEPPRAGAGELADLMALGIAHEEQHQELILTDTLAAFACHPLKPVYRAHTEQVAHPASPQRWHAFEGGPRRIGARPEKGFFFDNEAPNHDILLAPFAISNHLVTVAEWAAFAAAGGYDTPSLWLSDGIEWVRAQGITGPAYLRRDGDQAFTYGLHGERIAHPDEPVLFLSYYEADAIAAWLGARLPTEAEWETAAADASDPLETRELVPRPATGSGMLNLFGAGWQWTRSSYEPYPGFRKTEGVVGEYNGKFMVNQRVLRGSSFLTTPGHSRPSYRNFWHAETRFQAAGLRLARDL